MSAHRDEITTSRPSNASTTSQPSCMPQKPLQEQQSYHNHGNKKHKRNSKNYFMLAALSCFCCCEFVFVIHQRKIHKRLHSQSHHLFVSYVLGATLFFIAQYLLHPPCIAGICRFIFFIPLQHVVQSKRYQFIERLLGTS